MTLLLAAVGATVTALLELTVGPYLRVGTAQPHLVLVVGIVVTVAVGLEAGLVWAFVGGLVLDVLAQRPLGSTVVRAAALRGRDVGPRPASSSASARRPDPGHLPPESGLLDDPVRRLQRPRGADPGRRPGRRWSSPAPSTTPSLAALIGPLAISIHDRRADAERMDW